MARRARLSIVIVVTRGYYRMSSLRRLELAAHRLVSEPGTSVARLLGYANRHVLRIDHADDFDPEPILRATDDMVRRLARPPRGTGHWVNIENLAGA